MLANAFFEHDLSIVGGAYRENPTSISNDLGEKVATLPVLPGFGFTKEFAPGNLLCYFRERRAGGHLMEQFSRHNILYETIPMNRND
jgi:hypothetical protein